MADFVFNIAKGRVTELANRVNNNDPANSIFLMMALASTGIETDAVLRDKDDFAAVVSGTTNESTNTGYGRKSIDNTGGIVVTIDDTNDRVDIDLPDQTWTGLANDGTGAIGDVVFAYDSDSTAGTDSSIVPMTLHDFALTPDGSDVTVVLNAAGFFRAS